MIARRLSSTTAFSVLYFALIVKGVEEDACRNVKDGELATLLSFHIKRNEKDQWVTIFNSYQEAYNSTKTLNLDLKQRVSTCGAKQVIHIQGKLGGEPYRAPVETEEKLRFYDRSAKNVAITNMGRTAFRKDVDGECCWAGAITNRPLKPDELFEVRLEKMSTKYTYSINIGVTTINPSDIEIKNIMYYIRPCWLFYTSTVYVNGTETNSSYGRNLEKLQVGDHVGIMRKFNGDLHMYINRIDQGVAAKDIPFTVYGILDVRDKTTQISIVENASID